MDFNSHTLLIGLEDSNSHILDFLPHEKNFSADFFEAAEFLQKDSTFDLVIDFKGPETNLKAHDFLMHLRQGDYGTVNKDLPVLLIGSDQFQDHSDRHLETLPIPLSKEDFLLKINASLDKKRQWIDDRAWQKLQNLSIQAHRDVTSQLVQIFKLDAPQTIQRMRLAQNKKDYFELARLAHTLRSSCANLGILRMRDLCGQLESLSFEKKDSALDLRIERLESDFKRSLSQLQERV